jgi:hypothetical protein
VVEPRYVLALFIDYLRGNAASLNTLAEQFRQANDPLAEITRELADAQPDIPEDFRSLTGTYPLDSGTGWQIVFQTGTMRKVASMGGVIAQANLALIRIIWSEEGDWRSVRGIPTPLAPAGPIASGHTVVASATNLTQQTIENAFRACKINMLSGLLVGQEIAYASTTGAPPTILTRVLTERMSQLNAAAGREHRPVRARQGRPEGMNHG